MKLEIVNIEGKNTGKEVDLPNDIFGIEPNDHAIYLTVKQFLANQRQGTHKSKPRNEVAGSTKKIKKQKGTGTARAGDIKNPIFRGGGRIFGPEPRDYSFKVNKKVKALAKKSALTYKASDKNIFVIEDLQFDAPKTRNVSNILKNLGIDNDKVLFIVPDTNLNVSLSARNIMNAQVSNASQLNTYDILNAQKVVISEGSIKVIQDSFTS